MKANKPTMFLAFSLRRADHIPKPDPQIHKNTYSSNPQKILIEFHQKLVDLYRNIHKYDQKQFDILLSSIQLPFLSTAHQETLDKHITDLEVQTTIKTLKLHKRPGSDDFPATYYKCFATFFYPLMVSTFNSLLDGNYFRTESLLASIAMIPKPHTDDTSWSNYRSISILNLDVKILAKILSNHLNPIIRSVRTKPDSFLPDIRAITFAVPPF